MDAINHLLTYETINTWHRNLGLASNDAAAHGYSFTHFVFLDDVILTILLSVAGETVTVGEFTTRTSDKNNLPGTIEPIRHEVILTFSLFQRDIHIHQFLCKIAVSLGRESTKFI